MNTPRELHDALEALPTDDYGHIYIDKVLDAVEEFFHSPKGLTMLAASSFIDQGFELRVETPVHLTHTPWCGPIRECSVCPGCSRTDCRCVCT